MDYVTEVLRDKIAIATMTALIEKTNGTNSESVMTSIAIQSYKMADIMMSVKNIPAE